MKHYYASGSSVYLEETFKDGTRQNRWFLSTQCQTGIHPTARELDDAKFVASALTTASIKALRPQPAH